jgi:hypothetical protein
MGKRDVADWWLARGLVEADDSEAAAKPATTTRRARTRTMSFIVSNLSEILRQFAGKPAYSDSTLVIEISLYFSYTY